MTHQKLMETNPKELNEAEKDKIIYGLRRIISEKSQEEDRLLFHSRFLA